MANKPQNEKFPIIVPKYRGYISALNMYAPIVTPILVPRAQLQQMLLSGLEVYLYDLKTKMTKKLAISDLAGGKNPMTALQIQEPKKPTTVVGAPKKPIYVEGDSSPETLRRGPIPVTIVNPSVPQSILDAIKGKSDDRVPAAPVEEPVVAEGEDQNSIETPSTPDGASELLTDAEAPAEPVQEDKEPVVETEESDEDNAMQVPDSSDYFSSIYSQERIDESQVDWDRLSKKQRKKVRAKIDSQKAGPSNTESDQLANSN